MLGDPNGYEQWNQLVLYGGPKMVISQAPIWL